MDAREALDGAAVDHDLIVDGFFDLRAGDGDILELAENVGELHVDELNFVFLNHANNVFPGELTHFEQLLFSEK